MIHDRQSAQISQKQDEHNIYVIMKTMCPPGYHRNGFVATHALRHMMYGYRGSLMTIEAKINPNCLNPFKFKISPHPLLQWWNWFRKTEVSPRKKKRKEKTTEKPTNQPKQNRASYLLPHVFMRTSTSKAYNSCPLAIKINWCHMIKSDRRQHRYGGRSG